VGIAGCAGFIAQPQRKCNRNLAPIWPFARNPLKALKEARFTDLKQTEPIAMPTDSGRPHDIHRCPQCTVALWSDYGRRPGVRFVRLGTLDDPSALSPDVHIFTRSKLPWFRLPEDVPSFEVYYKTRELWPAESLERLRAVSG